jgi:AcrR family transcriptional regulator
VTRLHGEERRLQLLAAAREEFLRVGPEGARISDIARRAEVNVALLYRYFDSKDQMFEQAVVQPLERKLAQVLDQLHESESGEPGSAETVLVFYRSMLGIFTETFELFSTVLFSDRARGHAFYQSRIVPFMDSIAAEAAAAGQQWPQQHDSAIVVPMSTGMCWGLVMDAHFREIELDLDAVAAQLADIRAYGVLGRPRS